MYFFIISVSNNGKICYFKFNNYTCNMKVSNGTKILGGAVIVFALYEMSRLGTAKKLQFKFDKLDIKGLDKVYIFLQLINDSNGSVNFNSIDALITLNGLNVGKVIYNKVIAIKPNSTTNVKLPVSLNVVNEINFATMLIQKKATTGIVNLTGKVMVDSIPFPIDQQYKLW